MGIGFEDLGSCITASPGFGVIMTPSGKKPTVIQDSLLGWFKHDEGAGAVLTDYAGTDDGNINGDLGTFWGNTAPNGTPCGTYGATGGDRYVDGLDAANWDIASGGITIMIAVYLDSNAVTNFPVVKPQNYAFAANIDEIYWSFKEGGSTNHTWETTAANLAATTWYILTVAYTYGTGSSIKAYVNLTDEAGSWTAADGDALPTTGLDLQLGKWGTTALMHEGRLGDILIYNRQLSLTEITHNYNVLKGRYNI